MYRDVNRNPNQRNNRHIPTRVPYSVILYSDYIHRINPCYYSLYIPFIFLYIPIIFPLDSWGSLFGVPIRILLVEG